MKARPLTSELEQCLQTLLAMIAEIETVLSTYLEQHQTGPQHADALEIQLFCQTLRKRLETWLNDTSDDVCEARLAELLGSATQLDRLSRNPGDSRLDQALLRLAEGLRIASPALLRWCHGGRVGNAYVYMKECEKRFHEGLTSLLKNLQAA
ncbi:MAG: hypothetical protein ACI8T1_003324 [Verrucomicrobiales bacterium]|jgi:hypothetical protein